MDDESRENLDQLILMTKLSEDVSYGVIKLDGKEEQIVAIAGHPVLFRHFCILSLAAMSGGVYAYIDKVCLEIKEFWKEIDFTPTHENPNGQDFLNLSTHYAKNPYGFLVNAITKASIRNGDTDFLPLMKKVSNDASFYS